MARKLTSALVIAAFGFTSSVGALGLGNIDSASTLNEPLLARIPLLSVGVDELATLNVELASSEAFERAGLERPFYLSRLKFRVATGEDGRPYIAVTTEQPVKEPFLDFLVDVRWPRGRLVREYTVLLDPPIYEPGDAVAPAVAASPATSPAAEPRQPAQASSAPRTGGAGVSSVGASAQGARAERGSVEEIAGAPAVSEYGPVQANETLWGVAQAVRPDQSLTINQTMLALLRANPDAFIDNNMNALRRGAVLRVPDRAEIQQASPGEALREVREQYAEWQRRRTEALAAAQPADEPVADASEAGEPESQAEPEAGAETAGTESGKLTLVAPEDSAGEQATTSLTDRGLEPTEANVDRLQSRLTVLEEGNASLEAENQDLKSQMVAMREELAALRSMVNLQMEQGLAAGETADGQPVPTEAAPAEAEAVEPPAGQTAAGDTSDEAPGDAAGTNQAMAGEGAEDMAAAAEDGMDTMAQADDTAVPEEAAESDAAGASAPEADTTASAQARTEPETTSPVAEETSAPDAQPQPADPLQGILAALPETRLLAIAGGGLLALLGLLMVARRRRQAAAEGGEDLPEPSLDLGPDERPGGDDAAPPEVAADGDAVGQAEIYIAYGNLDRAQQVLDEALGEDPDNKTLRLKLLDVLARQGDRGGFEAEAQVLHTQIEDHSSPDWQQVVAKGRELAPEHPLFKERSAPSGGAAKPAADHGDDDDFALDFELDLPPEEEPSGPSQDELAAGMQPDPFSEDVAEDDDGSGLDFDLGDLRPQASTDEPLDLRETELPDQQADTGGGASSDADEMTFDLDSLDIGTDSRDKDAGRFTGESGDGDDELQDEEPLDEAGTKLDLARAYLDMGDADGARSLLDEVVQEGDDQQRRMAEELLRQAS